MEEDCVAVSASQHRTLPLGAPSPVIRRRQVLLAYGLLDEAVAAIPVVGAPLLQAFLGLNYGQMGLLFAVGAASGFIFKPALSLWSYRHGKRWWILIPGLVLAVCLVAEGLATRYDLMLLLFACYYPAAGMAVGLAQAVLADDAVGDTVGLMTRWTLLAGIGDVVGPLAITALAAAHHGWRSLCWLGAVMWLGMLGATLSVRFPPGRPPNAPDPAPADGAESLWPTLRRMVISPAILRWGMLAWIPTMIDEILLAFAALYLHDVFHASEALVGLWIAGSLGCGILALVLLERVPALRTAAAQTPRLLLAIMAGVVLGGMAALVTASSVMAAGVGLAIVGLGGAGWYPIAKGQAFAQLPGRAALVRAMASLTSPLEALLAAAIGLVSLHFGLAAGIACLGTAPLLMLALLAGRGG